MSLITSRGQFSIVGVNITEKDMLKAKEFEFLNLQKKFLLLVGASFLAQEQLKGATKTSFCQLCGERCENRESLDRMRQTASEYQEILKSYICEKRQLESEFTPRKRCKEWLTYEMKKGRVKTIRQQKQESVRSQTCVSCGSKIRHMSNFLRSIDKTAQMMESELHNHSSGRPVSFTQ